MIKLHPGMRMHRWMVISIAAFLRISRDDAKALNRKGMLPARRLLSPPVVPDRRSPLVLDLNLNLVAPAACLCTAAVEE